MAVRVVRGGELYTPKEPATQGIPVDRVNGREAQRRKKSVI